MPNICDKCQAEYVNLLRHEAHEGYLNRMKVVEGLTGINYAELQKKFGHRAMEVWHTQVRQWIDNHRYE